MKLEWQENISKKSMSLSDAFDYSKSLGKGWRLPTIEELKEYYNGKEKFKDIFYYWTLKVNPNGDSNAIGVSFGFGDVGYYGSTNDYYVRCVREIK